MQARALRDKLQIRSGQIWGTQQMRCACGRPTFAEADAKLRRICFQSLAAVSASTPAKQRHGAMSPRHKAMSPKHVRAVWPMSSVAEFRDQNEMRVCVRMHTQQHVVRIADALPLLADRIANLSRMPHACCIAPRAVQASQDSRDALRTRRTSGV